MLKSKKEFLSYLGIKLAWLLILFFGKTGRISIKNRHYLRQAVKSGRPVIYVVWHGRMLLPIYIHRKDGICAMVSEHGDGEIIAKTIERLGYTTVRGSSTRGGSKAFRQMLKVLKNGTPCTILPDGPRGPRYEFKIGAVSLAQRSDALILPLSFSSSNPIVLKSWDRFTLWKPFAKLYVVYGKPMIVPRKISQEELEAYRIKIENQMNDLQEQADAIFSN